jgi:hypothetical protein
VDVSGNLALGRRSPGETSIFVWPCQSTRRRRSVATLAKIHWRQSNAQREYSDRVSHFELPQLVSSTRLVNLYNRSLLPLLLNRWEGPEFTNPYYSQAASGGCRDSRLWLSLEDIALYDPEVVREHIKQYLRIDLTKHFLFNLLTEVRMDWYSQRRRSLVSRTTTCNDWRTNSYQVVDGVTVVEHMIRRMYGDTMDEPQRLIDYGPS